MALKSMRSGPLLLTVALLFGAASARAQELPVGRPDTLQPAVHHAAPKAEAKKHAAPKSATKHEIIRRPVAKRAASIPVPKASPKSVIARSQTPKSTSAKSESTKAAGPTSETANFAPVGNVFAGIPPGERPKIQSSLLWSGDYTGAVDGEDPMLTAIKNFQKRIKAKVTGSLTAEERTRLVAAARDHEREFGWSVVVDPATGIRIGLPTKMVPHAREAARGTRWSSAHGEVQVETFRIKDPQLKLSTLFEQLKKEPSTRRVEYSVLHDDNFFISGIQGLKKFSVRAKMRDGEVRGFTMLFDQMMETIVSPVMVAMASSFSPFPERSAPFAALAQPVEYGNGLVVSAQGHIVTDRRLVHGCQVIVAAGLGDADRVADDKEGGLALLRVYGRRRMSPLSLSSETPKAGEKTGTKASELTLIGIPDPKEQDGPKKLTEIKARLADGSAIELRQPAPMAGFSGAAALDAQGRFVGMMQMRAFVLASTEAAAPPVRLISATTIRDFLTTQHVATAETPAANVKASLVRIICVRK
jgi:hypothetical protein